MLLEETEIHHAVVIGLEYDAASVAALGDVVRRVQRLDSR
jgi:hypothetical protein